MAHSASQQWRGGRGGRGGVGVWGGEGLEPRSGLLKGGPEGEKLLGQVCRMRQEFSLQPPRAGTVSFLFVSRITSTCYSGYEIVRQRHRKKHPVPLPAGLSGLGTDSEEGGGWEAGDGGGGGQKLEGMSC